jgi:hypothetical protein
MSEHTITEHTITEHTITEHTITEHTMKISTKISKCLTRASVTAAMITAALLLMDGARARDLHAPGPMTGPSAPLLQTTADLAKSATPHAPPYPVSATASGPKCWPCREVPHPDSVTALYAPGDSTVPRPRHFQVPCPYYHGKTCLRDSGQ